MAGADCRKITAPATLLRHHWELSQGKGHLKLDGKPGAQERPCCRPVARAPLPQVPGGSWAQWWGSARGPLSAPFSISLSFLICRERRTDPEHADPSGGAVLKVQNLLDASFPGLGTLSLLGGWAPCREAISAGGLSPITSPEKLPARWGPLGNSVTKPACMGSRRCSPAGAFRVRTRVAENVLSWLFWGEDFSLQELTAQRSCVGLWLTLHSELCCRF